MGCGTSKTSEIAEEKARLRRASQVQVDAVQRAEAAYRRQRMALEKEATSYRRASIEIQRARIMKEMYCSGNEKNGALESLMCNFGCHKEIANDNVCPDLTITEVEDENNEEKKTEIEQTPLRDIKNKNLEQKGFLTDDTKAVTEDEADQRWNIVEPGSENQDLTYELQNLDQQTVDDKTSKNIELESLEEENEVVTILKTLSNESGNIVACTADDGETRMGNNSTRTLSHAKTKNEKLASDSTLGNDNMQNEAKEGEIVNVMKV